MKPMKTSELREMPEGDLRARIAELEEERFRLRFRSATETLDEPLRLRGLRRDIARLHTVLGEKQMAKGGKRTGGKGKQRTARGREASR
jgi:large subunit ribosomal protein L29